MAVSATLFLFIQTRELTSRLHEIQKPYISGNIYILNPFKLFCFDRRDECSLCSIWLLLGWKLDSDLKKPSMDRAGQKDFFAWLEFYSAISNFYRLISEKMQMDLKYDWTCFMWSIWKIKMICFQIPSHFQANQKSPNLFQAMAQRRFTFPDNFL